MYSGVRYYLFTSVRMPDVRLVYAPPTAIGNFGGEVDNWMWPRHTGDFSLMRVYVGADGKPAKYSKDNVPFKPKKFLPVSTQGYDEGSFAMIMGFPGRTYRYREAVGIEFARDESLPVTIDIYSTRMQVINNAAKNDRAIAIKYASALRGMANSSKKSLAMLDGMRRSNIAAIRKADEEKFSAYVNADSMLANKYGALLAEIQQATLDLKSVNQKSLLLTNLTAGVNILKVANRFASYADMNPKDSLGNPIEPTKEEQDAVRSAAKSTLKDTDLGVDKETCVALLLKSAAMPPDHQLVLLKEIAGSRIGAEREESIREFVDDLYGETSLSTLEGCEHLLTKKRSRINADAFVEFARKIAADNNPVQAKVQSINTTLSALRGKLIQAWVEWKKNDIIYPDANRTLRFTYGKVLPLAPRDAVRFSFATTLKGVVEKESGEEPFVVPQKLKELWKSRDFGRYADAKLKDVPVAFLTDNDITGGNSGSPVINGKGELIGCAFDGNWEGVVGDYYFQEELNRTISVDARYVLFVLDKFSGAQHLLREMVIH
jgi:hypothetical protein